MTVWICSSRRWKCRGIAWNRWDSSSEETRLKARYFSAYRLLGVSRLAEDVTSQELFVSTVPLLAASVTTDPSAVCDRLERRGALSYLLLTAFTGRVPGLTAEQAFDAEVASLRAKRETPGVYVVFEGEMDAKNVDLSLRQTIGTTDFCLDAADTANIKTAMAPMVRNTLTALKLGHSQNADGETALVGEVIVLLDGDTEIYPLTFTMGPARLSVASQLTAQEILTVSEIAIGLASNENLRRSADLFVESHFQGSTPLFAYIAAWSALEIFVASTFSQTYQKRWYSLLEAGVPPSGKPVVKRFEEVMSDKLRLTDKFSVLACFLCPASAEHDLKAFQRLKKERDTFFHSPASDAGPSGLGEIQALLAKYLAAHIASASSPLT